MIFKTNLPSPPPPAHPTRLPKPADASYKITRVILSLFRNNKTSNNSPPGCCCPYFLNLFAITQTTVEHVSGGRHGFLYISRDFSRVYLVARRRRYERHRTVSPLNKNHKSNGISEFWQPERKNFRWQFCCCVFWRNCCEVNCEILPSH